jgi:NADH-quinone oxidoreductase subunit K
MITPTHYLLLSAFLFTMGLVVAIRRRQQLLVLLGIQLMLQAASLAMAALTSWFQDWSGEIAALSVIVIAAVELAAGLGAALVCRHRQPTVGRPRA